jgi:hypothetical protein
VHNEQIHLKLSGNMTTLDFLSTYLNDARLRLNSASKQIVVDIIVLYIFIENSCKMLNLLCSWPSNNIYWCCFIQSFYGIIMGVGGMTTHLNSSFTCYKNLWLIMTRLTISSICTIICLLSEI